MTDEAVTIQPIDGARVAAAAQFLHDRLNPRVPAAAWQRLLQPPWDFRGPDSGVCLVAADGRIAGVYAAVYSRRDTAAGTVDVCNLAAFCVDEGYRAHALRLVRAILRRKEWVFTDLSPSGNVPALNERLGFTHLDTATRLVVNLPGPRPRGLRVSSDPAVLRTVLQGTDAAVYRDHARTAAARHVVIVDGGRYAYVVYRRDRRKRLPLFATPLYTGGDPEVLRRGWRALRAHLLAQGILFTLAEHRVVGRPGGLGRELRRARPRMIRGEGLADVDYLYSELALVSW